VEACNFIPIHSLTGPVGQSFASCLGGTHSNNGTWFLLLALSCYNTTDFLLRAGVTGKGGQQLEEGIGA
jgi:hypothetical protein